jgi:hypothetical protein
VSTVFIKTRATMSPHARASRRRCKAAKASLDFPWNRVVLCAVYHHGSPLPNDQSERSTKTMLIMMSSGRTDSLLFSLSAM